MKIMDVVRQIVASDDDGSERGPEDDFWYDEVGNDTATGMDVSPDTATRITAVSRAVHFISETIASLPLNIHERLDEKRSQKALSHPLQDLLHDQPNENQTSLEFRETMQGFCLLRGNAVAEKIPGPRGAVDQLVPIHPSRLTFELLPSGRLRYIVRDLVGSNERILMPEDVFHLKGFSKDGYVGVSPITEAREALGIAMATEQHAGRTFSNGARPGGVLEHPGKLKPEGKKNLMRSWNAAFGGVRNAGKVAVLEEDMKFKEVQMTSKDAQFIESRQFSVVEIARIFGLPPHVLYDLTRSSFSNIETQSLELMKFTIRQWLVRWEQAIKRDLIIAKNRFFPKFNADGLLRGDTKTRFESYGSAIDHGWMTRNEARELEDMNPLPGLDAPMQPLNMGNPGGNGNGSAPPDRDAGRLMEMVRDGTVKIRLAHSKNGG